MKNEVITVNTKYGLLTYISATIPENLYKLQHKLRVKQIIYNRMFAVFNKDMDFTKSNIITDKR